MTDFIVNPRRAPRAPIRCEARAALREGGFWIAFTADYGPGGCQLAAPSALETGARLFLSLANERVPAPVQLAGRVAWSSVSEPWRIGVAFDVASLPAAHFFFEQIAAAYPDLDAFARSPDRLPADALLAPTPPPRSEARLTEDERAVLEIIGAGATATTVRERMGAQFVNAVFALLGRRHLVVGGPDAAAAEAWKPFLARAG
jgi:hypothetical protein